MFEVLVTGMIRKDGKVLITRRALDKKRWPGKWTVPGGHLEEKDFLGEPFGENKLFFWSLENAVKRETREEVGIEIDNLVYQTCITRKPNYLIINFIADYRSGDVVLNDGETDMFAWINKETMKDYDIIEGIHWQLEEALKDERINHVA